MVVKDVIQKHWHVEIPSKSQEELEAEVYLICIPLIHGYFTLKCIKFNRWHLFLAAFTTQFCIGSLYAWSVYNRLIDDYIDGGPSNQNHAVVSFYIACTSLGISAALLGPWLERKGPRTSIMIGTTLYLVGHVIAGISLAFRSIAGVYIGHGLIAGCGVGICYISPVSTLQKWFPDLRGTAAGFAVCGFGAGPIVWAKALPYPIQAGWLSLPSSFTAFGVGISIILYLCAIVIRTPPPGFTVAGKDMHGVIIEHGSGHHPTQFYRESDLDDVELHYFKIVKELQLTQCIFSIDFMFLWLMLLFEITFCLVVISRLADVDLYLFPDTSLTNDALAARGQNLVSLNAIFNFLGRLLWPTMSDVLIRVLELNPPMGRKIIFIINLLIQLGIAIALRCAFVNGDYLLFKTLVFALTFVYGGGFGTIPCFLCDMFGALNIGALHGIILTSWSMAGIVGIGFNSIVNSKIASHHSHQQLLEAYLASLPLFIIGASIGLLALLLVRTSPVDRFAVGYQYSVGRFVLFQSRKQPLPSMFIFDEPVVMDLPGSSSDKRTISSRSA